MPRTTDPLQQIFPSGLFITFEGIDGCGKTTQMQKMAHWLSGMK